MEEGALDSGICFSNRPAGFSSLVCLSSRLSVDVPPWASNPSPKNPGSIRASNCTYRFFWREKEVTCVVLGICSEFGG